MSLSFPQQIAYRGASLRALAVDSLVAVGFGSLLAVGILHQWWAIVAGIPLLCVFVFLAVQARQETLMQTYVLALPLLACLQVSIFHDSIPGFYAMVGLSRYALMGCVVVWGLVLFHRNTSELKAFDFAWLALLSLVAISVFYSVDRSLTIGRGMILAALFFSLFALVRTFKQHPCGSMKIVNALLLASACIFVPGFLLVFREPGLVLEGGRFAGVFASPSAASGVACMLAPLAFWGARHQPDPRARFLCVFLSPVLLTSLLLSQTRNAIAALVVGMFGMYVLKKKKALNLLLPAVALLVMFGVFLLMANLEWFRSTDFYANYIDRKGTLITATGRLYLWQEGLRKIEEHPLIGYGFGTGGIVIGMADLPKIVRYESDQVASYSDALPMLNLNKIEGLNAHNSYIEITLELGIMGLAACMYLLGCVTWEISRTHREVLPQACGTLGPYLGASFIAGLVNQGCESALFSAGNIMCLVFWFVVAAILCLKSEQFATSKRRSLRMITSVS